jgi:hypothetical protein
VSTGTVAPTVVDPTTFWVTEVQGGDDDRKASTYLPLTVAFAGLGALTVQTDARANCVAEGTYPSGSRITASGLGAKHADSSGLVRWSFAASTAEHGTASYALNCAAGPSMRTVTVHFAIP